MKKVCILFLSVIHIFFVNAQDSLVVEKPITFDFAAGDTLVNLNRLNRGVLKYQLPSEAVTALANNGLTIENPAVVIVQDPAKMGEKFTFEVKCFTNETEWYINEIVYEKGKLLNIKSDKLEMATTWRKEGKMYVVLATVTLVFLGLFAYLLLLDRRISKLGK